MLIFVVIITYLNLLVNLFCNNNVIQNCLTSNGKGVIIESHAIKSATNCLIIKKNNRAEEFLEICYVLELDPNDFIIPMKGREV